MLVVDVWTLVVPSAFNTSAGSPESVSTIAVKESHVRCATSRSDSVSADAPAAGRSTRRSSATSAAVERTRSMADRRYPVGSPTNQMRLVTCSLGDKPCAGTTSREAPMGRAGRRASAIAALLLLLTATGVGVVTAGNRSNDERALRKTRAAASQSVESKVNSLLGKMTLQEKLNQLTLLNDGQINDSEAAKPVGGVFSLTDPDKINHFQHVAVEQSRLHIPILFAFDTIHGYRTIFPIPLGTASSFDPNIAADDHRIGAMETAAVGIKQIYSPMVDVSHEPRWGRSSEGAGEDPYLNSVMAAARVKAAQGSDYSAPDKVVTSVKHYAAYGQPEAGRDYNTTDMSEQRLRNLYLPPFKAAVDAGAGTAMCSFNAINGVPGCANHETETDILKSDWGFDGFIESDYTAVAELRACPPMTPDSGPCHRPEQLPDPRRSRRGARCGREVDGPAQERRRGSPAHSPARPLQVGRRYRPPR